MDKTTKRCTVCGEVKSRTEFHVAGKGIQGACKPCVVLRVNAWREKHPGCRIEEYRRSGAEAQKRWRAKMTPEERSAYYKRCDLKKHFDMTLADYEYQFSKQGGGCAICGLPCATGRRLAVDHDHGTGKLRGLLCSSCNLAVGKMEAIPHWIERASFYLSNGGVMAKSDIYGRDPDGGAKAAGDQAVKRAGPNSGEVGSKKDQSSTKDMGDTAKP